jgi:hypothetical protein
VAVLASRGLWTSLPLLGTANRDALAFVLAATAAWGLSWWSAGPEGAGFASGSIAAMALPCVFGLVVALLPGRLRKN